MSFSTQPIQGMQTGPPFSGTIFLDRNIITSADPTSFLQISNRGQASRLMFDRRSNGWITVNAYLFNANYDDDLTIEIQVNPEFGSTRAALAEAEKYAPVIGRLPRVLRSDVQTVWIHQGLQPFGGGNHNLLIHTGQADQYVADGILEETLVHEASHTSLDATHAASPGWLAAMAGDNEFISTYAQDFPDREDVAESFLPYLAITYRPDRISASLANTILETIPNRIDYFDQQSFPMHPIRLPVTVASALDTVHFGEVRVSKAVQEAFFVINSGFRLRLANTFWLDGTVFSAEVSSGEIPAGDSVRVDVRFRPTEAGAMEDVLRIAFRSDTVSVVLQGTALVGPTLQIYDSLDFGIVQFGSSLTLILPMSNTGDLPLLAEGITTSDKQFTTDVSTITISPGVTDSISVTFLPTDAEVRQASLILNIEGNSVIVDLIGVGSQKSPDFTGDGKVDFADFVDFASVYGKPADPDIARFDLDGDGTVGFGDFIAFASAFGT